MRIDEALALYLVQLRADGRSRHTIGQYRRHVRLLAHWARHVGPRRDRIERLGHEDVAAFLSSPAAMGRAGGGQKLATSANCLRSSIKCFLAYCHRAGYIPRDPGRLIRRARCSPAPPRALAEADQRRLLAALGKAKTPDDRRDAMLFTLMLRTGIRLGSALAVHAEDVDLHRGELRLRTTKGDRPEVVILGREIRTQLAAYLRGRAEGPLFAVTARHAQRRFAEWLRRAGITTPASPHSLRHSFAMRVYAKTGDILVTKEALRHRSIASTLVYAHADSRRLRKAIG